MRVMIIGQGGREHALAWKLLQSAAVTEVCCVPGNGGTARLSGCQNLAVALDDPAEVARVAQRQGVDLVIIGPEAPLAAGLGDELRAAGLAVLGPGKAGAQIEASKSWAKDLMHQAGVPTAAAQSFTDLEAARAYLKTRALPIVIKADGLAAGKGVTVAETAEVALEAVEAALAGQLGPAGRQVLIEDYLDGEEVSVLALTDGQTVYPLLPAQDHKRIGIGDTGPNTGGMGAYAPVPWVTPVLMDRIQQQILLPTVRALRERGIDYRGILYAGLMIRPAGDPWVVEFNCRFGDPETQVVLPLLSSPLETLLLACAQGCLGDVPPPEWVLGGAACVVVAAAGYPGPYTQGDAIDGLDQAAETGALVFHAGTVWDSSHHRTAGGRVLAVTGRGASLGDALQQAYAGVSAIDFPGAYFRPDIGWRLTHEE
ncbi:MAG: phosphoribosylamine--glycine ligase [Gloeomargaritaceae cyanobacterium C42_A2020_066]|nr:phosphoribosylamine--glycine ligase [Gloeomargaritaceae cyanobacterium C42_A2020_066]